MDVEGQAWLQDSLVELQRHLDEAALVLRDYGTAFETSLARAYREEVGRLPGSARTKRLRKKRRTALWRWWAAQMAEGER